MTATEDMTALQNGESDPTAGMARMIAEPMMPHTPSIPMPAAWTNGHTARGVVQDMMQYTSQRMRAYAQHLEALMQCDTMQAAAERQFEFLRDAQADISSQLGSMMNFGKPKANTNTTGHG